MKPYFFLLLFIISFLNANAQLWLPSFFSNGMVLQQKQSVNIWGKDLPNSTIFIKSSWGGEARTTTLTDGSWKIQLKTPSAGGPYDIIIEGSKKIQLNDVLVGEVWFCSGQSNMEMPLKGFQKEFVEGSEEEIALANFPQIRFFNTKKQAFVSLQDNVLGRWQTVSPSNAGESSAVAFFFAKKIHTTVGVPVGIIHSSWGASTIEAWMDEASLKDFKNVTIPQEVPQKDPNRTPTLLYKSMLHPFLGFHIKGVLWYQGESNRFKPIEYSALFTTLIQSWRTLWGQGDFPFYFVQIAPFEYKDTLVAYLRESQSRVAESVLNTGMVVTLDIGEKGSIHPSKKRQVGERLANLALHNLYGKKKIPIQGPVIDKMKVTNSGEAIITFKNAKNGLVIRDVGSAVFEIAGADQVFYPAEYKIVHKKSSSILIRSNQVKVPISVRYAFKNFSEAALFNKDSLPAAPFRTDSW